MFEIGASVLVLCLLALVLGLFGKILNLRSGLVRLDRMLECELDGIKFGPEGDRARRETAERIGRIRG